MIARSARASAKYSREKLEAFLMYISLRFHTRTPLSVSVLPGMVRQLYANLLGALGGQIRMVLMLRETLAG